MRTKTIIVFIIFCVLLNTLVYLGFFENKMPETWTNIFIFIGFIFSIFALIGYSVEYYAERTPS